MTAQRYDIAILGGRVIDPESGLDAVRNVGVAGSRIAAVTADPLDAVVAIDASGLVVAPGFIDLHSHAQTLAGARLQALDGVTTALELEGGVLPVGPAYARSELEGRPIHFGYSAGWAHARLAAVCGVDDRGAHGTPIEFFEENQAHPRWNADASAAELAELLARLERGLDDGGLGIGVLLGYAPATDPAEFRAVVDLAARRSVPVFAHSRRMSQLEPGTSLEGARELIEAAELTGAHVHICHLNSTSLRQIEQIRAEVLTAQARGVQVSTEAYPYGAGSTGIGATFFAPEDYDRLGTPTTAIAYLPTGERIATLERLAELRATDPGGLCVWEYLDPEVPEDLRLLLASLTIPGGVIASDAMPLTPGASRPAPEDWPLPADGRTHPRSAGTFARALRWLVRDLGALELPEAIRRMTLGPARLLEDAVPAMRAKGRIREGADADLVVLDPATVADAATFEALRPSTGFRHVLVDGVPVVRDGRLDLDARPGRPIRTA